MTVNPVYGAETRRMTFVAARDGIEAAIGFARQGRSTYRHCVLLSTKRGVEKPHHFSFREYRRKAIQSYLGFKKFLSIHAPGT